MKTAPFIVAIYSRVSTTHHDQKPEVQIEELRKYCNARGWIIKEEIIDRITGSTENRPGLKRLLNLTRRREVDAVVVLKLDRLFRSLKHLIVTLDEFQSLGVQFTAIRDNLDYNSPSGKFFVQILGSLAEFEKSLLRERTILGLEHARSKGKILGRPKTRNDSRILELRKNGLSYTQIQDQLGISRGAIYRAVKAVSKRSY